MTDSGHQIGEDNRDAIAVVHPDRGILPWTCRALAGQAKGAFMERHCIDMSETTWQVLVEEGFRLQRVTLCPASPPFEGRANVTLAFEKAQNKTAD